MDQTIVYIIIFIGWIMLVSGTIWVRLITRPLTGSAKSYLNIALTSFYVLGYTCTVYWFGFSSAVGVIPAFVVFIVLFYLLIKTVHSSES